MIAAASAEAANKTADANEAREFPILSLDEDVPETGSETAPEMEVVPELKTEIAVKVVEVPVEVKPELDSRRKRSSPFNLRVSRREVPQEKVEHDVDSVPSEDYFVPEESSKGESRIQENLGTIKN